MRAKPETNIPSRKMLTERALADNALLIGGHIQSIGRLKQTDNGRIWDDVE